MTRRQVATLLVILSSAIGAVLIGTGRAQAAPGDAEAATSQACHPAYRTCIPLADDLNCIDIGFQVDLRDPSVDPYRIDDGFIPGLGCEQYPPADGSTTATADSVTTTTAATQVLARTALADTGLREDTAIVGSILLALGSTWVISTRATPGMRYRSARSR